MATLLSDVNLKEKERKQAIRSYLDWAVYVWPLTGDRTMPEELAAESMMFARDSRGKLDLTRIINIDTGIFYKSMTLDALVKGLRKEFDYDSRHLSIVDNEIPGVLEKYGFKPVALSKDIVSRSASSPAGAAEILSYIRKAGYESPEAMIKAVVEKGKPLGAGREARVYEVSGLP